MISAQLRDAAMVVDLKALKHNIKQQQAALPANSRILAVVKADAYGHGAVPVAHAAKEAGVDGFCVAMLDEGLELRNAGIDRLMLVLGLTPVHYAPIAALNDISLTVGSTYWLKEYAELAKHESLPPLKVHLALDTGMGRIGFQSVKEFKEALDLVRQPVFVFEGMFTHFATADEADDTYFKRQLQRWQEFLDAVDQKPPYVHMANSAVGMWHRETIAANTVRMGISMYGCNPSGHELPDSLDLRPVASIIAKTTFVKHLKAGESVSYGATYTAQNDEWVATLPIGYADGYLQRMQGFKVLVDGQECDILGRICMDQMMIRLPESMPVGTEAVLMGTSKDKTLFATDLADYAHTINYEILTSITPRLLRRYQD